MNLNDLIKKSKTKPADKPADADTRIGNAIMGGSVDDAKVETPTEAPAADESKPSVPLKVNTPLKLGASAAPKAVSESPKPATGLKLGGLPKAATSERSVAAEIPADLDLSALASLDTSSIPEQASSSQSAMQFPDEIEATAPVRELPEDLTAQQQQFIESLNNIYEVLHDADMLGQSIRMVMQELQEFPEYTKLISDHDVHTMIKSIRNVMGITKIRKEEKSAKRGSGGKKSSASSKFDADTMAQLDAMMAGSKAFDDE